jgi:FkbM family methyltransferase
LLAKWSAKDDTEFYIRDNSRLGDTQVIAEVWDADCYRLRSSDLPQNATIVDGGANIGIFSILAKTLYPDALLITVEPDVSNLEAMLYNFDLHGVSPSAIISAALWDHNEGTAWLSEGATSVAEAVAEQANKIMRAFSLATQGRSTVRTTTLEELLRTLPPVDLLKLDIESSEERVILSTPPETMERIERIVGEFHMCFPQWGELVRYLSSFFELTITSHPYPHHMYGGSFRGVRK